MKQDLIPSLENILIECTRSGNSEKAVEDYLSLLEKNPEAAVIYFYLGLVMVRLKNIEAGVRYLEMAKNANLDQGQRFRCLIFLGKAYADARAFSKAERAFREALQTGVPEPGAYSALGAVFYERSMVQQAIDALRKALEIDPNYPGALNNLGYILIETRKDKEEGVLLCSRAVDLEPDNPAYRDSLGKAFMSVGRYEEAEKEFQKAMKIAPEDKIVSQHLLELRQKMERS